MPLGRKIPQKRRRKGIGNYRDSSSPAWINSGSSPGGDESRALQDSGVDPDAAPGPGARGLHLPVGADIAVQEKPLGRDADHAAACAGVIPVAELAGSASG